VDSAFRHLDRYQNIQPWSNNRVKLKVPDDAVNYINASPIVVKSQLRQEGATSQRYIAMQGPKKNTLEHVWRMVAEQLSSPAVIVMLTETHEGMMEKCYPYYPHKIDETIEIGEQDEFDDGFRAQVKCIGVEAMADGAIEVRRLAMRVEGSDKEMEVWHLLYKRWPDFGVPAIEDLGSFFELMALSRDNNAGQDNPRVVHCSAGVGRSGTFIALENLMRDLDSGELQHYDQKYGGAMAEAPDLIFDTVNALREQRKMMVQSEAQFLFIYQVMRKLWIERYGTPEANGEPAAKRLGLDLDPFVESRDSE
jgi:protein-tyrosine phosphatase